MGETTLCHSHSDRAEVSSSHSKVTSHPHSEAEARVCSYLNDNVLSPSLHAGSPLTTGSGPQSPALDRDKVNILNACSLKGLWVPSPIANTWPLNTRALPSGKRPGSVCPATSRLPRPPHPEDRSLLSEFRPQVRGLVGQEAASLGLGAQLPQRQSRGQSLP